MAAPATLVIVMMIVGMRAVVVMMVVSVPVIMAVAITLMLGIVTFLITPSGHEHLKVLGTVGMVVILAKGPVIQQGVPGK